MTTNLFATAASYNNFASVSPTVPDALFTDVDANTSTGNDDDLLLEPTMGDGRNFRFEDPAQRIVYGTVVCFVTVFGFVGNLLVILAVILSSKLQTRTNVFVVNLAVADLITCATAPFNAIALFSMDGWPMPLSVCSFAAAIYFMCLACSIANLAAIALNRFVLITKSSGTYFSIYTPRKIAAMVGFTWVYPAVVCSLPLFGIGKWGYSAKYKTCTQDTSHESSDLFSLLGSVLIYPVPLGILFVCYYKIYRHISQHTNKMVRNSVKGVELSDRGSTSSTASTVRLHKNPPASFSKRQVEITKNLFYVMCAFIACLAPFAIALVIPPSDPVIPWTGMIINFNSCVNPVIYGLKHPHFKTVFRHLLRCQYHMIPEPSGCLRKIRSK